MLALDVGTSSVRALLVSPASGRVLFRVRAEAGRDGFARVDADTLWADVVRVLDAAEARLAALDAAPLGCGVSVFWHSALLADRDGRPLGPVHLWSDTDPRFARSAADLRARVDAERTRLAAGAPIHPSFPAGKALALLADAGSAGRGRVRLLGFEDLLALRLFGRLEKSLSMASATGLWDGARGDWHAAVLDALGLSPTALAAVETETGEPRLLAGEARRRWPRLARAPWRLPRGDGALSNAGLHASGDVAGLTVGTSSALRLLDRPLPAGGVLPRALFRYLLDPGRPVVGGALSQGGNLIAHIAALAGVRPAAVDAEAAAPPLGAHGVVVMPGLWGERSPDWPDSGCGGVVGLRADTPPAAIVRAAMDSVGAGLAAVADALDEAYGRPFVRRVRAGGRALARSTALAQVAADAIGLPLDVALGAEESSALGAAALAAAGDGGMALAPARAVATFEPRAGGREAYRALGRRLAALRAVAQAEDEAGEVAGRAR